MTIRKHQSPDTPARHEWMTLPQAAKALGRSIPKVMALAMAGDLDYEHDKRTRRSFIGRESVMLYKQREAAPDVAAA
jgi:hypothetical protein